MAFLAADRAAVRAFYGAARAAGGRSNGSPGLRPHYHPNYYAAFVLDPMATTSRRFVTCRAPSTISAERCEARVAATPRAGIGGRYLEGV